MIIPNGILNDPGMAYVRDWLLKHARILTVVDMHRDLFQPGNDTQTSIVGSAARLGDILTCPMVWLPETV